MNRTVCLVETLFCQKFSNQSYSQQQLVKMAAQALKAVSVAQGSLASQPASQPGASFACRELLLLIPCEAVGRSSYQPRWWGLLPLHGCSQSPQFPSFATLQLRYASFLAVSRTKIQVLLFQSEWQTMISQGFTQLLKSEGTAG